MELINKNIGFAMTGSSCAMKLIQSNFEIAKMLLAEQIAKKIHQN